MVASLRRVLIGCFAAVLASSAAVGQRPTFSLVPTNAEFERRCVGGPEAGQACTTTADCERDGSDVLHPECVRVCELGDNHGEPCNSIADCSAAGSCVQQCFCNNWVSNPPPFILTEIVASNWSPEGQALSAYSVAIDIGAACDAVSIFASDKSQGCPEMCPDWIFCGYGALTKCNVTECTARFASVIQGEGPAYTEPMPIALLTLLAQPAACGRVDINFLPPGDSFMADENYQDITPLDLENLTIVFEQECSCVHIVGSTTPRCTIDPRQESEPDGSAPAGWTTIEFALNAPCSPLSPTDFAIREVPGTKVYYPTTVQNDVPEIAWVTLTFPPTTTGVWTCIRHVADVASEWCLGTLPGDTDESGMVEAADVVALVDCLGASPQDACDGRVCDIDRSGSCGASDLLRAVDLLGGAEAYNMWLGHSLPDCPNP